MESFLGNLLIFTRLTRRSKGGAASVARGGRGVRADRLICINSFCVRSLACQLRNCIDIFALDIA